MLYSELINQTRKEVGDVKKTVASEWTADGTTKIFLLPLLTFPVLASSYTLKKNGITLTETTDYTIDLETGRIDLVTLPAASDALVFIGMRVALTDETWIEIANDTVRALGDDYWKEVTDITTYTSTAHMKSLALTDFVAVYDVGYYPNSASSHNQVSNWRFSADDGKLYFGDYDEFSTTGLAMRIRGLKKYTLATTAASTFDVQDRFLTVIKYGMVARYWRYKMREIVESLGKITQDSTRTNLQELIMLIDRYERWYERDFARLKPPKPARFIPAVVPGKPRP